MSKSQQHRPRKSGKGRGRKVTFGYFQKSDAVRIGLQLEKAGIPCRVGLDRDFARVHHAATDFHPALRRARSHRDVTVGYFVRVPAEYEGIVRRRLAEEGIEPDRPDGEEPVHGAPPDFDADPRWCPHCRVELPPKTKSCPECATPTVDILQKSARRDSGPAWWVVVLILALLLAVAAARLF